MSENRFSKVEWAVKALRVVLITSLILYSLVFIASVLFLVIAIPALKMGAPHAGFWAWIRQFLGNGLTGLIYFFIAYSIFKLINLISHGEPFSPASPRHIRRIACAVFGLAIINATVSAIYEFTSPEVHASEAVVRVLYGGLSTLLLGFGFLVIARVLEVGVRLQQDQNLTV